MKDKTIDYDNRKYALKCFNKHGDFIANINSDNIKYVIDNPNVYFTLENRNGVKYSSLDKLKILKEVKDGNFVIVTDDDGMGEFRLIKFEEDGINILYDFNIYDVDSAKKIGESYILDNHILFNPKKNVYLSCDKIERLDDKSSNLLGTIEYNSKDNTISDTVYFEINPNNLSINSVYSTLQDRVIPIYSDEYFRKDFFKYFKNEAEINKYKFDVTMFREVQDVLNKLEEREKLNEKNKKDEYVKRLTKKK